MTPAATIVVTSRDRRDELREMLPTALAQTADVEVLVIDDGSTDGTAEMVRAEFPEVRLERSETSLGLIAQRTRAAEMARAPIVVSVDDDARLPSPETVAQTLADFDHPRIGAVAIPFVDVRSSTTVRQQAPDAPGRWVTSSYIGTAHALRREVFRGLGGYRTGLGRQAEEPDFCLRMLDAGLVVRLGTADHILHLESPRRQVPEMWRLAARNDALHGFFNVPMPYLPVRLAKVAVHWTLHARAEGQLRPAARGLADSARVALARRGERRPVSRATYRLDHEIRRRGPVELGQLQARLPAATLSSHAT